MRFELIGRGRVPYLLAGLKERGQYPGQSKTERRLASVLFVYDGCFRHADSLAGSVGVINSGFGFIGLMD